MGSFQPLRCAHFGSEFVELCRMDAGLVIEFFNLIPLFPKLRLEDRVGGFSSFFGFTETSHHSWFPLHS